MNIIGKFINIGNPMNLLEIGNLPNEYDFRINSIENFHHLGLLNLSQILMKKLELNYILNEGKFYLYNSQQKYFGAVME